MKPNYRQIAEQIIENIGGKENVEQAAHCVTRLRLTLKNQELVDQDALLEVPLVKGAFLNAGVYQIVIGAGDVDRVYAEFIQLTGLQATTHRRRQVVRSGKDESVPKVNQSLF